MLHQGAVLPMFELPRLLMLLGVFVGMYFLKRYIYFSFSHFSSRLSPGRLLILLALDIPLLWCGWKNFNLLLRMLSQRVFRNEMRLNWQPPKWRDSIHLHAEFPPRNPLS